MTLSYSLESDRNMRLYVGTLYSNENEFEDCVRAIQSQNFKNYSHFIFKSLPKKEAHETLFGSFIEKSNQFEVLVKVDADMVINDPDLFGKIAEKFRTHPQLELLEIAVHDFFSDQLIWGLNSYRRSFQWKKSQENLFTDFVPIQTQHRIRDNKDLAPASIHCKNPGRFQSFHYGVHKAVKVMQPKRDLKRIHHTTYHWDIIQKSWDHFIKKRDVRLGFAVLGAELAFYKQLQVAHLDYTNPICHNLFSRYANYDCNQIYKEIKRIRRWSWGLLGDNLRRDALCYLEGGHMLQISVWPRLVQGFLRYLQLKSMRPA